MRPENILAWSVSVEYGYPPPLQPPFDEFGNLLITTNTTKNGSPNKLDAEAYLNHMRQNVRKEAERKTQERVPRRQHPHTLNPGSSILDREAYINDWKRATIKQQRETAERERMFRQRKILFPDSLPKEHPKPEPNVFRIPQMQRKPVPKSSNEINPNPRPPPPPQTILLRNGETKRIENRATYTERIRELGYPEILCPLPMKEIDCTGAKVVKQGDDRQLRHENRKLNTQGYSDSSSQAAGNVGLTPEMLALAGEFRTLKVGEKRG